jgi:hypothetical protein
LENNFDWKDEPLIMDSFMQQIKEDIRLIQQDYSYLDKRLTSNAFTFNYWILNKLYSIDEEMIPTFVTDINDKGIDCFVHYEDTKELFIIQNKYYDESTSITREEIADFLITPLKVLSAGNYKRSPELQKIFDRVSSDSEYKIWLHFYVTNNLQNKIADDLFSTFNFSNEKVKAFVGAKLYRLKDIKSIYYGDRFTNKVSFVATLPTKYSATSLDVRPKDYGMDWMIDLRYVMVNVADLYNMYQKALEKNYEIFEENIREFLGTRGINNGIITTLKSPSDRENFFYYNNGITIICEDCKTLRGSEHFAINKLDNHYGFELKNPQIVNGCQTINSIAEVLSHYSNEQMRKEFNKTYVLVKVFVLDQLTRIEKKDLEKNIVRYTNSQNGINDKAFASKHDFFKNLQTDFISRGFLLLVKPSDKNEFMTKFHNDKAKLAELYSRSKVFLGRFLLPCDRLIDIMVPLEKLLKVLLAFEKNGYIAFRKGSSVLKPNSPLYKNFSLNISEKFTTNQMLEIYLLFAKAEAEKKKSADKRIPISYYLIGFIGSTFKSDNPDARNAKFNYLFSDTERLSTIYDFFKNITGTYMEEFCRMNSTDYNNMIKQELDFPLIDRCINSALRFTSNSDIIKNFIFM